MLGSLVLVVTLSLYTPAVALSTIFFSILKLCILPKERVCVFGMVLPINSDCFPNQH
jgi:energy-converting hydrogenase Eha subunit A